VFSFAVALHTKLPMKIEEIGKGKGKVHLITGHEEHGEEVEV
jgi:hypothetical protein